MAAEHEDREEPGQVAGHCPSKLGKQQELSLFDLITINNSLDKAYWAPKEALLRK